MILPYLIIMPSLLSALGLKAIFNSPFTLVTGGLPPFIIAVGTGDSIHILTIFYRQLEQGKSKEDAIAYALAHSGPAIVMTTVTTAAGLLSSGAAGRRRSRDQPGNGRGPPAGGIRQRETP